MKLKMSELFFSLQGEGKYVGTPSIFLRTFGCNFTCGGFGMPIGEKSKERTLIDPSQFFKYSELPLVKTGCDSYASWDPKFKNLSKHYSIPEIGTMIKSLLPIEMNGVFNQLSVYPRPEKCVHLIITGGEPLLGWQKIYPDLLDELWNKMNLTHVTFETNGTQEINEDFSNYLIKSNLNITFSISPKLQVSGEVCEDAIKPKTVLHYQEILEMQKHYEINGIPLINGSKNLDSSIYFKFVVDKDQDIKEIKETIQEYENYGICCDIYLMPIGGTGDLYYENNKEIAKMALMHGWKYSPRIQVDLWKNAWGT